MATYSYATQILIEQIGKAVYGEDAWNIGNTERALPPIKNAPVPLIPCQFHGILAPKNANGAYPGGNMYPDKSWEGARAINRGGRKTLEYFGGFNVMKDQFGRCLIPATPNNVARLDAMKTGKKQVIVTQKVVDPKTGEPVMPTRTQRVRTWVPVPAAYTRIEGEGISGDIGEIIKAEVAKALAAQANPLPPDEEIPFEQNEVPAPEGVIDLGQPAAPATGGEDKVTPPAASPQPSIPARKATPAAPRTSLSPTAVAAAAASAEAEF